MPLKLVISKQQGKNIHSDKEIYPPHLDYDISLPITFSRNRHMKY